MSFLKKFYYIFTSFKQDVVYEDQIRRQSLRVLFKDMPQSHSFSRITSKQYFMGYILVCIFRSVKFELIQNEVIYQTVTKS